MDPTTPTQPDRITAAELRAKFIALDAKLEQMEIDVHQTSITLERIAAALASATLAASQQQQTPASSDQTVTFDCSIIVAGIDDNGQPTYKAKGGQYQKFGVRIWPELLPALGIDPAALKPGPNQVNLRLVALIGETGPRKVISLAK
jgi:hypothetical protein